MNKRQLLTQAIKSFVSIKLFHRPKFNNKDLLLKEWYKPTTPLERSEEPRITWIGQSTFLIQIGGTNILTDPIFFQPSIFFPRLVPPGISLEKLPHIDVILISHNHKDHFDKKSLLQLKHHNPTILIPSNLGMWFSKNGFGKVAEHHWGDKEVVNTKSSQKTTFTFLPAKHWVGSSLFDINESKPGSWMIEYKDQVIYFAGDSAYGRHFKEIAQDFLNINTALLPIGPIEPVELNGHAHINPKQAIQAFLDLQAKTFVPMHWGTFQLALDSFEAPIQQLQMNWLERQNELMNKELFVVKFGEAKTL